MANKIFRSRYKMQRIENLIEHGAPIVDPTSKHWLRWDIDADDWSDTGSTADAAAAAQDAQAAQALAEAAQRDAEQAFADATEQATQAGQSATAAAASAASANELVGDVYKAFPTESSSGTVASTDVGADGIPLKSLSVQIEPVQSGSGDPSPVNQRPISGWTEANIFRTANNLLGGAQMVADVQKLIPAATVNADEGYVSFTTSAATTSGVNGLFNSLRWKENAQYTLILTLYKTAGTGSNIRIIYTDGTYSYIGLSAAEQKETVVVVTDAGKTVSRVGKTSQQGSTRIYYDESGVFEGVLTATDFEEYLGKTYTIAFPASAGTVFGGTLTDNGDGTCTMIVTWYSIPGSQLGDTWIIDTAPSTFRTGFSANTIGTGLQKKFGSLNIMCDRYKTEVGDANGTIHGSTGNTRVYITDTSYTTTEAFIAAIADAQFVYELVTPKTYTISTDSVRSLLGDCNVWADCGDVEAVFRCDPTLYIDAKLAAIGG